LGWEITNTPIRARKDERPELNRFDDSENRVDCGQTYRHGQNHECSEAGIRAQLAPRIAKIANEGVHGPTLPGNQKNHQLKRTASAQPIFNQS